MDWSRLLATLQEQFKTDPAKAIATVQQILDTAQMLLNIAKANPAMLQTIIGLIPTPK